MATNTNINNTQNLDEKKEKNKNTNTNQNNIFSFLTSILITLIIIIFYFGFAGIILYECKLAQSNILPTNTECYPFTEKIPDIQKVLSNIFVTGSNPQQSIKLGFPYDKYNQKNSILDGLRKYKENPDSNFIVNFFIEILEGMISYNNNAITTFFNLLNQAPEVFIVLLGPFLSLLFAGIVPFIGLFVFIFYYFKSIKWLFLENENTSSTGKPIWKYVNLLNPVGYGFSFVLAFVFFILFWILLFTFMPILCFIIFYICVFFTLGYKGEWNGEKATLFDIIQSMFKYYKLTIVIIFSIFLVLSAFSNLGTMAGIFSLLVIFLIYFNIIPIGLFTSNKPSNLSSLSSFEQAEKICDPNKKTKNDLFGNIGEFFTSQKGGGIAKELKKLVKKMEKQV